LQKLQLPFHELRAQVSADDRDRICQLPLEGQNRCFLSHRAVRLTAIQQQQRQQRKLQMDHE
jgi:hypothetical protein